MYAEFLRVQFTVLLLSCDSNGCDEMGDYFATEADTMIYIVYEAGLNKDWFKIFIFNRKYIKLSPLNVKILFSIYISIYFTIIRIRKYVIIIQSICNKSSLARYQR